MTKMMYVLFNDNQSIMVGVFSCFENATNAMLTAMEGYSIDAVSPGVVVNSYRFISPSTGEVVEMSIERATLDDPFFLPHTEED